MLLCLFIPFLPEGEAMKKKIAVFASGWGDEYFREVVSGIYEAAKTENIPYIFSISSPNQQ